MSRQAERDYTPRQKLSRTVLAKGPPDRVANVSSVGAPYIASNAAAEPEPMPLSPAWLAREEAADRRLRRSMNICSGCRKVGLDSPPLIGERDGLKRLNAVSFNHSGAGFAGR